MSNLKKQTVSGIKWVLFANLIQRAISFGATIILARLLNPTDFGLFALAFIMIDAFTLFRSLGIDSALVRQRENFNKAANTAFLLIPIMGMLLFITLFFIAPIASSFLGNKSLINIIRVLAIVFVISCFGRVPQTVLYKNMKFKYRSIGEIAGKSTYVFVAVFLALKKCGVWSLVFAYIAHNLIQVTIEWYFSKWRPKFEFDKKLAWEMFHFGKFILASSLITFLSGNLDNIVIGKLLGVTMLGYYAIAKNAANLLSDYFLGKIGMIMFPAYAQIQENKEDIKRIFLKTLKYLSIIAFPFGIGLCFFSPQIIQIVFGEKWMPASHILRLLALSGILNALACSIWPIFLAQGKSKFDFQINLIQVLIFLITIVPLTLKFQLIGIGISVLISSFISLTMGIIRIKKIIKIDLIDITQAIKTPLLCSLLMLVFALVVKNLLIPQIIIILTFTIYIVSIYCVNKNIFKEIKNMVI